MVGDVTMDAQQVSCAKALLNKVLPDLQAIANTDDVNDLKDIAVSWLNAE
jgi:hypothetical protein